MYNLLQTLVNDWLIKKSNCTRIHYNLQAPIRGYLTLTLPILALIRTTGLKQNVNSPLPGLLSAIVTNSIMEIYEVRVQLPGWLVTLHLQPMYDSLRADVGKGCHMLSFHPTQGKLKSFSRGMLTNKQLQFIKTLEPFTDVCTCVIAGAMMSTKRKTKF